MKGQILSSFGEKFSGYDLRFGKFCPLVKTLLVAFCEVVFEGIRIQFACRVFDFVFIYNDPMPFAVAVNPTVAAFDEILMLCGHTL